MQLYLDYDAPEIKCDVPLKEAKETLISLYREFCFKKESDLLKSFMSLLTPFCRGLYKEWTCRTPVYISFANRERAGKDYLAGIKGIVFDNFNCVDCKNKATQVHHLDYDYLGDEKEIAFCISLCRDCHEKRHGLKR